MLGTVRGSTKGVNPKGGRGRKPRGLGRHERLELVDESMDDAMHDAMNHAMNDAMSWVDFDDESQISASTAMLPKRELCLDIEDSRPRGSKPSKKGSKPSRKAGRRQRNKGATRPRDAVVRNTHGHHSCA